jgi:cAMP-binding proteins - catabolite gene activator and regulatory subunit of cAMP-dependent protein kinases
MTDVRAQLATFSLFQGVSEQTLDGILREGRELTVPRRATLLLVNDTGYQIFFLLDGYVKVIREHLGEELIVAVRTPGEIIGEMAMFSPGTRSATVHTLTESRFLVVPMPAFQYALRKDNRLLWNLTELEVRRLREATQLLHEIALLNAERRVLQLLRMLAEKLGHREGERWVLPRLLSLRDMASMINLRRETFSRVLRRLEDLGLLEKNESVISFRDFRP